MLTEQPVCDGGLSRGSDCCHLGPAGRCELVVMVDGQARCSLLLEQLAADPGITVDESWDRVAGDPRWLEAPVGRMFAERWPGRHCGHWPQDIPEVMSLGIGLCCHQPEEVTAGG